MCQPLRPPALLSDAHSKPHLFLHSCTKHCNDRCAHFLPLATDLFTSVGNIGGFLGPAIIGLLVGARHSFTLPTALMGVSLATAGALVVALPTLIGLPSHMLAKKKKEGDLA